MGGVKLSNCLRQQLLVLLEPAVAPGHRGKGVGQALLQAVEDEARRRACCKATLEVRSDNAVAMAAYRRAGFASTEPETYFWSRELG